MSKWSKLAAKNHPANIGSLKEKRTSLSL